MSLGAFQGVVPHAALAAGVSVVSILKADDWARVSTLTKHYVPTYITTTD